MFIMFIYTSICKHVSFLIQCLTKNLILRMINRMSSEVNMKTSQSGSRTTHARDSYRCWSVQPSVEQRNCCSARHCHLQCLKSSEALFCCACVYMLHACIYLTVSVCLSVHLAVYLCVCAVKLARSSIHISCLTQLCTCTHHNYLIMFAACLGLPPMCYICLVIRVSLGDPHTLGEVWRFCLIINIYICSHSL